MIKIFGDLFEFHKQGNPICIPTNSVIDSKGQLVMGAGLAKDAKDRFPELPFILGKLVKENDAQVYYISDYNLFSFPTKHHWKDKGCIKLIEQSALELKQEAENIKENSKIYLPPVGCGLGGLKWFVVQDVLEPILNSDRFVVVIKKF